MKQQILINKLNQNDDKLNELKTKIENYLQNKELIIQLENKQIELLKDISNYGYDSIGVQDINTKITITPCKIVDVINYEKTLENVDNKENYKKDKISRVWNDDKIINELNVVYDKKETNPRATITLLKKE